MIRGLVCLFLFLDLLVLGGAQAVERPSAYVDSSPLGAQIILDGKDLGRVTPALLRGLSPGPHTVTLWRRGFVAVTQTWTSDDKVPVVRATLPPESVVLAFPANDQVTSAQGPQSTVGKQFRYPTGSYYLSGADEAARLFPQFFDEGLVDSTRGALGLLAGSTAASGTADYLRSRQGGPTRPSLLTASLGAITLAEGLWYGALQDRRARFLRDTAPQISPEPEKLDRAVTLFNAGEAALQAGDLTGAEANFSLVVRDYPDSRWVPAAWFRLARLHSVTGRRDLALGEYRLVAETFPQAAYHDRAQQAMADLEETSGHPDRALGHLDQMVLADGFFDRDSVDAQKARLTAALETPQAPADQPAAPSTPTPRQGYERMVALFGEGHRFTPEEVAGLTSLGQELKDQGDGDLAADLELVRVGTAASDRVPASSGQDWAVQESLVRQRESWLGVRTMGATLYGISAATALVAASLYDRAPSKGALWTTVGALGTAGLSLFPLLWAEPRQ